MEKKKSVSMMVIRRLPKYHRHLHELLGKGIYLISSEELGRKTGFTAVQVRQDLYNFGGFGRPGCGYNVEELYEEICKILNINNPKDAVIIGAGNIGQAIANYKDFDRVGFKIKGLFDINQKVVGLRIKDIEIQDIDNLPNFLQKNKMQIGVVCVPANSAQSICDLLISNGIKGIWNFAPIDLIAPENVVIENVHLSEILLALIFQMNSNADSLQLKKSV